jgi:hypothetical protein
MKFLKEFYYTDREKDKKETKILILQDKEPSKVIFSVLGEIFKIF